MNDIKLGISQSRGYENANLEVKGTQEFLGKEIPVIYGGFGSNQKVVLAKTVAEIHDVKAYHINELINRNIGRFRNGIDLLDLKVIVQNDNNLLKDFGLTQMQISKANNIYLLSERGYAKLIKIMDSDLAWEIHDQLMDEYFLMREEREQPKTAMDILKVMFSALEEQKQDIVEVKEDVQTFKETLPIFTHERKKISKNVRSLGTKLLGGKNAPAYKDKSLRSRVYSDINKQIHREFGVESCEEIKRRDYALVFRVIQRYSLPSVLEHEINYTNNQMSLM